MGMCKIGIHMIFCHQEAVALGDLENAVASGGRSAGARRVVDQRLREQHARLVQLRGGFECLQIQAVGEPRHGNHPQAAVAQLRRQHEVTRILHQHGIAGGEQRRCDQVKRVRCAVGDHQMLGSHRDVGEPEPLGQQLPQCRVALQRRRFECRPALAEPGQRRRRDAVHEPLRGQEAGAGGHDDALLLKQVTRESQNGVQARGRSQLDACDLPAEARNEVPGPGPRLDQSFGAQSLEGRRDRVSADARPTRQLTDRGQAVAFRQAAGFDQAADLLDQLVPEGLGRIAYDLEHVSSSGPARPSSPATGSSSR